MAKRLSILFLPALLVCGCTSVEPYEQRIQELTWRAGAAEQAAEQAAVDSKLAEREVDLAQKKNRVLKEQLALAYDALREARASMDTRLQERITALSEAPAEKLSISQYGGVALESEVLFSAGSHILTRFGEAALMPLVETLMGREYDAYTIDLAGHTDTDPIKHSKRRYRDNWDLGAMRANSVRRFLVKEGVPEQRVHLSSWGPTRPLTPGDKSRNRRVEFVLRPKADTPSLPASSPR